jgi:hypothetical protein
MNNIKWSSSNLHIKCVNQYRLLYISVEMFERQTDGRKVQESVRNIWWLWFIYHLDFDLISNILVVNYFKFMYFCGFMASTASFVTTLHCSCDNTALQLWQSVTLRSFLTVLRIAIILVSSSHDALECLLLLLWSTHTTIIKLIIFKQYLRTVHILWKKSNIHCMAVSKRC